MMTSARLALGGLGLAVALGLGYAAGRPGPRGPDGDGGDRPLDVTSLPADTADSARVARFARQRCGALPSARKAACYEEILFALVQADRVRLAMGALHLIGDADPEVRRNSHQFTHGIGIAAYRPDRDVGQVFASCTELYQSGCYHGVIQAYFTHQASVGQAQVRALCARYTVPDANQWIRFQCVHGMGHGLTMFHAGSVPRALAGCDLLEQRWDRESCYGGVFMENIVGTTAQQHHAQAARPGDSAAALPSAGGHAGMDHGSMDHGTHAPATAVVLVFAARNPADPYYPCSVVGDRYGTACYSMQGSIILELAGRDYGAAATACAGAPERHRRTCFQSLGTNAAGETSDDARALALCGLGDARYQPWCVLGLVRNRINVTARAADGLPVCAAATGEPNRLKCYEAIGLETAILMPALPEREAFCAALPAPYADACRVGARLGTPAPPGLPRGGPEDG